MSQSIKTITTAIKRMEAYGFQEDEKLFENMILDLITPELHLVSHCLKPNSAHDEL